MRCPLCGYDYEPGGSACSTDCPFGSGCHLACCPNCGYQSVDERKSRLAAWIGRLFGGGRDAAWTPPAGQFTLAAAPSRRSLRVVRMEGMSIQRETRLQAYGLSKGAVVQLLQTTPAPMIRVGETDLGVSSDVLDQVWVTLPMEAGDGHAASDEIPELHA